MLINTNKIFIDRKSEIEFYFNQLLSLDEKQKHATKTTINEKRSLKIMKSNFILMLYNLVEAVFVSGIQEIYSYINAESIPYSNLTKKLQHIWINAKFTSICKQNNKPDPQLKSFLSIVNSITTNKNIKMKDNMLDGSGNFNSDLIKKICIHHGIYSRAEDKNNQLEKIRLNRNKLAHGEESFSDCMRDYSIADLNSMQIDTINFIKQIILDMESFCNSKSYKQQ